MRETAPVPGVAKRSDNFSEICATAATLPPGQEINTASFLINMVSFLMRSDLKVGAPFKVLWCIATKLDRDKVRQGKASVHASNAEIAYMANLSERAVQQARVQLEELGLVVRRYNQMNRPVYGEGWDLAPIVLKFISGEIAEELQLRRRACQAAALVKQADREASIILSTNESPRDESSDTHTFAKKDPIGSLCTAEATQDSIDGLRVAEIAKRAPRLNDYASGEAGDLFEKVGEFLIGQYPGEPKMGDIWAKVVRKHGRKAIIPGVLMMENERLGKFAIKSPIAWLTWFAKSQDPIEMDWSPSLDVLLPASNDGIDLEKVDQALRSAIDPMVKLRGSGTVKAWIVPLRVIAWREDRLILSAPNNFHADYVRTHLLDDLMKVCRCAKIEIRSSSVQVVGSA